MKVTIFNYNKFSIYVHNDNNHNNIIGIIITIRVMLSAMVQWLTNVLFLFIYFIINLKTFFLFIFYVTIKNDWCVQDC